MEVRILGVGHTTLGQLGHRPETLALTAARRALADADVEPGDLGLVLVANALGFTQGQAMIRGQAWLAGLRLDSVPVVNIENGCAAGVSALALGRLAVLGGEGPVLVLGVECMWSDRDAANAGLLHGIAARDRDELCRTADGLPPLVALNGRWARQLIDAGHATIDQLAAAAVKAYRNGHANPCAQHRKAYTADEVLSSRMVAEPLTRLMCSSFTDGAAAVVLGTGPARHPVVRAVTSVSGDGSESHEERVGQAARRAFDQAGVSPSDVDLVELHDVTAAEELSSLEAMGFYAVGDAGPATERGATAIGGELSVNPSGGLLARGHPLAATGLFQLVEVSEQLMGRSAGREVPGARLAMVSNSGGVVSEDFAVVGSVIVEAGS